MRKRSLKRAKQEREYAKLRVEFLEDRICEAQVKCQGLPATEVHHAKGRIGELLTDTRYFKAVCPYCHHWIELHPKEAKELGLSVSRLKV